MMKPGSQENHETTYRPTRWFYQRFALSWIAVTGMALYFLYDGAIGYPKKNYSADLYDCVRAGQAGEPLPNLEGRFDAYEEEKQSTLTAAHKAGADGTLWATYSRTHGLSGKPPKRYSDSDIDGQFYFAMGFGVTSVALLVWMFRVRTRHWTLRGDSFTTAQGETVFISNVTKIDLRKWERGIVWLSYNRTDKEETESRRVKIDEYFYNGSEAIYRAVYRQNPEVKVTGDVKILTVAQHSNAKTLES